ncbi:glycerophosphoryl diester phosphodiesterase [Sediminibacillus albus]|uniref:Glycerophosphoryl diester phosphodiesterase n=1 Tax=Sediminibacillus albus TaxID=407036 RepID=A0A1G8VLG3_9BACI|nr:glycerophosphodiester phosphodiesterase [Sediminibacillus albus]SDJ66020.1 glycerophosphoryl diester phosphodiesterase [Sediminibacillus albus]
MKTLVYAHRGASKLAPENTMPAFQLAYEMGAEGIETDVQLSKDGIPVLIHDETVRRTTNAIGFVQDYTYEQLQNLDAGSWFSEKFENTPIISLEEFLAWAEGKNIDLNIELKNNVIDYSDLEKKVYQLLIKYKLARRTTISSFNPASIERFKHIDRKIATALLTSQRIKGLVDYAAGLGAHALHIKHRLLNSAIVEQCFEKDMALRVYTINRVSLMKKCYQLKADAIFTDVPDIAIDQRQLFTGGNHSY